MGVSPQATARQVRKAYKKLARRHHPDVDPSPGASERFMAIKAAHDEMLRLIASGGYPAEPKPRPRPRPPPANPWGTPPRRPPPPRARAERSGRAGAGRSPSGGHPWVKFEDGPVTPPGAPSPSAKRAPPPATKRPPDRGEGFLRAWATRTLGVPIGDLWTPTLWVFGLLAWGLFAGLVLQFMHEFDRALTPVATDEEDAASMDSGTQ